MTARSYKKSALMGGQEAASTETEKSNDFGMFVSRGVLCDTRVA